MKILFINGTGERAGAERTFLALLKNLDRTEVDPVVAFLDSGPFVEEVSRTGTEVMILGKVGRLREVHKWSSTINDIRGAIARVRPDLVHSNGEKVSLYAARAARGAGVPIVAWLQDSPGSGGMSGYVTQTLLSRARCDRIVVCANWMADEFRRRYGMETEPIVSGCDTDALPAVSTDAVDSLRSEIGWPDGSVVIGHFARLQRWKGTETFIESAAMAAASSNVARFLVVGGTMFGREGGYEERLRAQAAALGLGESIHFTGYRADALQLMAGVDVVVHCSTQPDPFPTVVLEGMGLGRAVVASRSKGPEEAVEHGRTGLLTNPGDAGELASTMKRLVDEPGLRQALGTAARQAVFGRFSARRMAEDFQGLYRRLVAVPAGDLK